MKKNFLVSGGTGGIGTPLCRQLSAEGYRPIIGYHKSVDAAQALAEELDGKAMNLDLADPGEIDRCVSELKQEETNLSGVVFAASPPPSLGPFGRISDEEMNRQWAVNVAGPRKLLGELLRHFFRKEQSGSVIAILTAAMGDTEQPATGSMGAYVISKFGLKGVLVAAKAEFSWLKTGIVYPGFTETPMLKAFDKRYLDKVRAEQPNGGFSNPDDVAAEITELIKALA